MQALQTSKVAALSAAMVGCLFASVARAEAPVRIALLPIVVHSADDPTYLIRGLADMLSSRLEQAGGFEVIRVEDEEFATTRLSTAIQTASGVGAQFVLFGSFTRFGTGASLDMQCVSTSEDFEGVPLREIFVHSGSIGEVIPDLDELVGKVGRFAIPGFGETSDVAAAPPAVEASVPPAPAPDLEARIEALEKAIAELTASAAAAAHD